MSDLPPGYTLFDPSDHSDMPPGYTLLADPKTGKPITSIEGGLNSGLGDFIHGVEKPVQGMTQLLGRGLMAAAPEGSAFEGWAKDQLGQTEHKIRDTEAEYKGWRQGNPPSFSPAMIAGEMLSTAPLAMALPGAGAATLPGRLISGIGTGALAGATQPVDTEKNPDYLTQKIDQTAEGAAWGALGPVATGALAQAAKPSVSDGVAALTDRGVRPTIGQMMGGPVNRIEQAATSMPLIGDFIKSARARSVQQFNRGAVGDVLSDIGETLETPGMGRDVIAEMGDKVSRAYDRAVPQAGAQIDPQAAQDFTRLQQMARFMPADRAQQFDNMLQSMVLDKISPNGSMTGQSFKEAESDLGKTAAGYIYNRQSTSDERQLGGALREAQAVLRQWLERTNPQSAADIQAANSAYAKMLRVENASARPGEDPGVFSPAQFQAAVKKFASDRQYAQGRALMQDYADAGRSILGPTVPDSGTPLRSAALLAGGALAGHGAGMTPGQTAALLGGSLGTAAVYNPLSQSLAANLLARRPPWADPVANAIRGFTPIASTALPFAMGPR
jgi:hypothetical protein